MGYVDSASFGMCFESDTLKIVSETEGGIVFGFLKNDFRDIDRNCKSCFLMTVGHVWKVWWVSEC